jgi:hypothetical protein
LKNPHPILVVVLVTLLLLPGLAYIGLRLTLPADASSPMVDFLNIQPAGLAVQPTSPDAQSLQNGDVVTAIQGQATNTTLKRVFSLQILPFSPGQTGRPAMIQYEVQRGDQLLQVEAPLTAFPLSQLIKNAWSIYIYLVFLELVSLLVFIMRPRLAAARLFFIASNTLIASSLVFFLGLSVDDLLYPWLVVLYLWGAVVLYGFLLAALVNLVLVFPKPHPILVRHPRWRLVIYLGVWFPLLAYLAARWSEFVSPAARLALIVQGTSLMSVIYFPLLLLSTFSSYRTSNAREKRQVRWIMWGLMISLIPYLVFSVLPSLLGINFQLPTPLLGILWCAVPLSFAIAVLHERLFDIDVIIRRTLIYSALTLSLGAVYFVSVLLLQGLFQEVVGRTQSPLAIVLSTLMIAVLFNPLRRRIQNGIDRRFYRRRYDTEKILQKFALQLRNEVDIRKITADLLNVVEETMEPQNLSLWFWNSTPSQQSLAKSANHVSKRSE